MFVDATGDGDLAAQAGWASTSVTPSTGECQPMSLIAVLTGLRFDEVQQYTTHLSGKGLLLAEMERAGVSPSYAAPTLICVQEGTATGRASGTASSCSWPNHEYGVSATDADQITRATLRAPAEVHRMVAGLRSLGGVWRDLALVGTGAQIGVREARRVHGRYVVSTDDLLQAPATRTPSAASPSRWTCTPPTPCAARASKPSTAP